MRQKTRVFIVLPILQTIYKAWRAVLPTVQPIPATSFKKNIEISILYTNFILKKVLWILFFLTFQSSFVLFLGHISHIWQVLLFTYYRYFRYKIPILHIDFILWRRIFPPSHQRFGGTRVRTTCFLARSGMIFGPSSDFWGSCHSMFIETLDQRILTVWCVDCERKCEILMPRRSPNLCTRSQRKWMRCTGRRARKSHRTLILQRVHLLANALCAVNLEMSVSLMIFALICITFACIGGITFQMWLMF